MEIEFAVKPLECVERKYICVEAGDLDRLVKEVYGHEFETVADVEAYNGFRKEFMDIGEHGDKLDCDELNEYQERDLEEFKKVGMKKGFMTRTLLNDLCRRGYIEPGNYLIDISW